mmetsp:Transcript_16815/g.29549  ORF Transcript_16815/g.29549 Transcript_16815/m.29549 type:complete len:644 (+) Transcript_16815:135-2066(+)
MSTRTARVSSGPSSQSDDPSTGPSNIAWLRLPGLGGPRGLKDYDPNLQITEQEEAQLKEDMQLFSASIAAFAAWRASRIRLALIPFALYIVMVLLTCIGLRPTVAETLTSPLDEKYRVYFAELHYMAKIERYCVLVSSIISWVLAFVSVNHCAHLTFDLSSVKWVRRSIFLNLFVPFMLVLFIPFRDGLNIHDFRLTTCQDFIVELKTQAREKVQHDWMLSYMFDSFVDESLLRTSFCQKHPDTWGESFIDYLSTDGKFTIQETCPSREITARRLTSHMESEEVVRLASCTAGCDLSSCSGSCPLFLAPLSLLVAEHGEDEVARDDFAMVTGNATACRSCFQETIRLGCIQTCVEFRRLATSKICLTIQELDDLKLLAKVVSEITLEKAVLGLIFGLRSLFFLIPLALAIVTGVLRGGSNAHAVLTQSNFPGFISLTVSTVILPFIIVLMAFVQNLVGNPYTGAFVMLFVINYILGTKFWQVIPTPKILLCIVQSSLIRWVLRALMAGLLIWGIFSNSFATTVINIVVADYSTRESDSLVFRVLFAAGGFIFWNLASFILVYFGQSFILSVFFADSFITLTYHFQSIEAHQSDEEREELWEQVECLRKVLDPEKTDSVPRLRTVVEHYSDPMTSWLCRPTSGR